MRISLPFTAVHTENGKTIIEVPTDRPVNPELVDAFYALSKNELGLTESQTDSIFAIMRLMSVKRMIMQSITIGGENLEDVDQSVLDEFNDFDDMDDNDEFGYND